MIRITPFELERYTDSLYELYTRGHLIVHENGVVMMMDGSEDRDSLFARLEDTIAERRRKAAVTIQTFARRTVHGFVVL